jgi:hypothetical protein
MKKHYKLFACFSFIAFLAIGFRASAAPDPVRVTVAAATPTVQIRANEKAEWRDVKQKQELSEGMAVRTGPKGAVILKWRDGNSLKLEPFSLITIDKLLSDKDKNIRTVELNLTQGRCMAVVKKPGGPGSAFVIKTPVARSGVRGTTFAVDVAEDKTTSVATLDGQVFVAAQDVEVLLEPGFESTVLEGEPPSEPAPIPPEMLDELKKEAEEPSLDATLEDSDNSSSQEEENAASDDVQDTIDNNIDNATNEPPPVDDEGQDDNCCP